MAGERLCPSYTTFSHVTSRAGRGTLAVSKCWGGRHTLQSWVCVRETEPSFDARAPLVVAGLSLASTLAPAALNLELRGHSCWWGRRAAPPVPVLS